jgi:hypothetical protein
MPEPGQKVWVALEGPDMTYYGTAELHGIYSTREAAVARMLQIDPTWKGASWENKWVFSWEVDTDDGGSDDA